MRYPRLVKFVQRELDYDRVDYTREQRMEEIRQKCDLNEYEMQEIENLGLVLCPETVQELYKTIRDTEFKLKAEM